MNRENIVLYSYKANYSIFFSGLLRWFLGVLSLWCITALFPQWIAYPGADLARTVLDFLWIGCLLGVLRAVIRPVTLSVGPVGQQTQVSTSFILLMLNLPLALLIFAMSSLLNTIVLLLVAHFSSLYTSGFGGLL